MRAWATLLLGLGLGGCTGLETVARPAPWPPPVRPSEVAALPTPPAPAPAPETAPTPTVPPAPPPVPPPTRPSLPSPAPPPAASPPRVLAPHVSSEDERRIHSEAQRRIDGTERMVRQIDERRLGDDQQQNLLTIRSFLVKAREALSERDVQRAMTLADKAYLLASELVRSVR